MTEIKYFATPAPRTATNPLVPISRLEPIRERLDGNNRYAEASARHLLPDDDSLKDWAMPLDFRRARGLVEQFSLDMGDDKFPQLTVLRYAREATTEMTDDHVPSLLVEMGRDTVWDAIELLASDKRDGNILWDGPFGYTGVLGDLTFVVSGNRGDAYYYESFAKAVSLLAASELLDEPFVA